MTVSLLSLGTELTRGELVNDNATWLADQLTSLGHDVREIVTVSDDDEHIKQAVARLSQNNDAIISTGGLGPTTDDRTTQCLSDLLGVPLSLHEDSLRHIEALFAARNVPFSPSNRKQALFPEGATVLPNSVGTAPGFSVDLKGCSAFFLPGVPAEMRRMFTSSVTPLLPHPAGHVICRKLRTYGMPESQLGELLSGIEEEYEVTIGYRASVSQVEVKVLSRTASATGQEEARKRAEAAFQAARERLGSVVFTTSEESLEQAVGQLLTERGLTLGLAESCTGGLVSELLTRHAGASEYYLGGICSYANSVKTGVLGVLPETLETHGAVSEQVALEMAAGASRALGTDLTLALTGIAGPSGGTEAKPVGLVHWAVVGPMASATFARVFHGERARVQRRAAYAGLWSVREMILTLGGG